MNLYKARTPGSVFAATERFIIECGGIDDVAEFTGKRLGTVYNWTDPEKSEGAPFGVVAQLSRHFRVPAAAEFLAACAGGLYLPLIVADGVATEWSEALAQSAEEVGQALAQIARSLSPKGDGGVSITREEAAKTVAEIDDAVRLFMQLRAMAEAIANG